MGKQKQTKEISPRTIVTECGKCDQLSAQGIRNFRAAKRTAINIAAMAETFCDNESIKSKITTMREISKRVRKIKRLISEIRTLAR